MKWHGYQLGDTVSKTTENVTLWKTEKGVLEIEANTLALPIELNGKTRGFVFRGKGKLLLDAIIETDKGAVGKSVEKELKKSFLMLGSPIELQTLLGPTTQKDFEKLELEDQQSLLSEAENLLDEFFNGSTHNHGCVDESGASVFAFPSKARRLDILVAKDSKLVYAGNDQTFLSHGDNACIVLKSPEGVVVSHGGRSIFVNRHHHCRPIFTNKCHRYVH